MLGIKEIEAWGGGTGGSRGGGVGASGAVARAKEGDRSWGA